MAKKYRFETGEGALVWVEPDGAYETNRSSAKSYDRLERVYPKEPLPWWRVLLVPLWNWVIWPWNLLLAMHVIVTIQVDKGLFGALLGLHIAIFVLVIKGIAEERW